MPGESKRVLLDNSLAIDFGLRTDLIDETIIFSDYNNDGWVTEDEYVDYQAEIGSSSLSECHRGRFGYFASKAEEITAAKLLDILSNHSDDAGYHWIKRYLEQMVICPEETNLEIINKALTHKNSNVRAAAVDCIRYAPPKEMASLIRKAFGDSNPFVRYETKRVVRYVPTRKEQNELIDIAEKNGYWFWHKSFASGKWSDRERRAEHFDNRCGAIGPDDIAPLLETIAVDNIPASLPIPIEVRQCKEGDRVYNEKMGSMVDDIDADRACFWNSLLYFVPQTPFSPTGRESLKILDAACGYAYTATSLVEYFKKYMTYRVPFLGLIPRHIEYTGVDIDVERIENARKINPESYEFIAADLKDYLDDGRFENMENRRITESESEKEYDVIRFRHPGPLRDDEYNAVELWTDLIASGYERLAPNGIMIVSTYYCYEYLYVKDLLENHLGATIYLAGINPSYSDQRLDRDYYFMIVGRQPAKGK